MSPAKTEARALTVWMVLSASVIRVLGEKGNWLLLAPVFAPLRLVPSIRRRSGALFMWGSAALEPHVLHP